MKLRTPVVTIGCYNEDTTHDDSVKVFHQNGYTCMMNITNAYIYTQWAIKFKPFQIANVQGLWRNINTNNIQNNTIPIHCNTLFYFEISLCAFGVIPKRRPERKIVLFLRLLYTVLTCVICMPLIPIIDLNKDQFTTMLHAIWYMIVLLNVVTLRGHAGVNIH